MNQWSAIWPSLWHDDDFVALNAEARLVFLYAVTASGSSGLLLTSVRDLIGAFDSTVDWRDRDAQKRLEHALGELTARGMVEFDWPSQVIWAVNKLRYNPSNQNRHLRSEKIVGALKGDLRVIPYDSPVRAHWMDRYGRGLGLDRRFS